MVKNSGNPSTLVGQELLTQDTMPTTFVRQKTLERQNAERQRYSERLRALREIDLAILNKRSLEEIAAVAVQHIKEMLACEGVVFILMNLEMTEGQVIASDFPLPPPGYRFPLSNGEVLNSLQQGVVNYIQNIETLQDATPMIAELIEQGAEMRPTINFPLRVNQELIGIFSVTLAGDEQPNEEQLEIGREIANVTAVAVHNARLLAAARKAGARENTLRYVANSLTANLDLDSLLELILEQLESVIESNSYSILLYDGQHLHVAAHRGTHFSPQVMANIEEAEFPNMRRVLESGQPLIIPDSQKEPDWVWVTGGEYIRCWLGVPLLTREKPIGILALDHRRPHFYTEQDARFVKAFADQVAVAIENARLFRQVQEQAEQLEAKVRERTRKLEALYEVSAVASAYLDLPTILQHSLTQVLQTIDCNAGTIHIFDEQDGQFKLAAREGLLVDPEIHSTLKGLPLDHPLAALVGDAQAGNNQSSDRTIEFSRAMTVGYVCETFQDCAVAPLQARGQLRGILTVFSAVRGSITPESLSLMETIAEQIGVAIENNDLRQQARQVAILEERERLAYELHDSVTQSLYSLTLFAEAVRETAAQNDLATVRRHAISMLNTAQQTLREMRLLLYELNTKSPITGDLVEALRDRLRTVEERAGVLVKLHANEIGEVPAAVEEAYYRIALEALNNALRHANAENVSITLRRHNNQLLMVVEDDGRGFDVATGLKTGGMGLSSMQRRVTKINGNMTVHSQPGRGVRITVRTRLPA